MISGGVQGLDYLFLLSHHILQRGEDVYTNILCGPPFAFFCLFDLILYVLSIIFQLCRHRSSWVEPVLR